MAQESSSPNAGELIAAVLAVCNVPTDDARIAHLGPLVTDLLNDGEHLVNRVSVATEPMTVMSIHAQVTRNDQ